MRSGFAMLNVPTLWTAFVVNFLALGLIWAYVMRSYPAFVAARFWTGAAFAAAARCRAGDAARGHWIRWCRCWPAAPC